MSLRSGIQTKLFLLISALVAAITLVFTIGSWRWYGTTATRAVEQKALTYGQLVGRSAESAIAFDDHETAREAFDAVSVDPEVSAIALFREDGSILEGRGDIVGIKPGALSSRPTVERSAGAISCQALVTSREGPRGAVVVVVSKDALKQQLAALQAASAVLGLAVMVGGFIVAWRVSRSLARRIGRIAAEAGAVAAGSFNRAPVQDDSTDEVGRLAGAFNTMVGELRRLVHTIESSAAAEQERLQSMVAQLASRNRAMRLLLDSVGEGFLMLDRAGGIGSERSAAVDQWFGTPDLDATFWQYLASKDPDFAAWFEVSWEALTDNVLPYEVVIEQFPKRLEVGSLRFDVTVTPIFEDGLLASALVDIRDVTPQLARERVEGAQRDVLSLLEHALDDGPGYREFMAEAGALIDAIVHDRLQPMTELKRAIHTLKGACCVFGLVNLASYCHAMEDRMENDTLSKVDRTELDQRWRSTTTRLSGIFLKKTGAITIERQELDAFIDAIESDRSRDELLGHVRMLRLQSVDVRLKRFVDHATGLAARLDKRVEVSVDGGGLRFDPVAWGPFWGGFSHVLRNAIDHGIESHEQRELSGKPPVGMIAIRARLEGKKFILELSDDGRGIDWTLLAQRASIAGLPTATPADLEAALFADGLSTKSEVSDISGRGVGLGAARACCEALGGETWIKSMRGSGTTIGFAFPHAALGDAYAENAIGTARLH